MRVGLRPVKSKYKGLSPRMLGVWGGLSGEGLVREGLVRVCGNRDCDTPAHCFAKYDLSFNKGKNCVVFAKPDICARVPFCPALANNYIARHNMLATEFFDP